MASNSNRMNKIDEELKKEIGNIISTELKNPHLTGLISVTKVKTTPDLRFSKVYVSMINESGKEVGITELEALENKENNSLSLDEIEINTIKKNELETPIEVTEENEESEEDLDIEIEGEVNE